MRTLRKASWFPWLSLLMLAALLPVQAAGCCKLGMLLSSAPEAPAMERPADHSCCPRSAAEAPAPAAPARDCEGGQGCCLEGVDRAEPALVSIALGTPPVFTLVFAALPRESAAVVPAHPALPLPEDSGPPLYLAHRRLLI